MSEENHQGGSFFRGLVAGAVLGAMAIWFLNQTEKGKEIKKEIKEKSGDVLENLNGLVKDLEDKGQEFKKKVVQVKKEFEEKAKDFRQDIAEEAQMGLSRIEELEEKGHKAAQKFFTRRGKPIS
jgi:gas vesicle protein